MYAFLVTVALLVLYEVHLHEGRMIGRFRRDTSRPHVEAIYSRYKQQSNGEATYYGYYPGGGACSLDPLSPLASQPGWIRVAAGSEDFQNSLGCGMCLEITGTGIGKGSDPVTGTRKGIVHDLCGGCKQGDLDLYIPGDGRWEISFKAIDCPNVDGSNGNIMMRFTGSNPWYIKLQARNTRVPVAGIEVLKNGRYSCLKRVDDNYFVGDGLGKVDFPMQVRLTAVTGEQRETIIPNMKNDQDTLTDIQFTGHEAGGGVSSIMCMGQGNSPPYPAGGMEPGSSGVSPGTLPSPVPAPAPAPAPAPLPPTYPSRPENVNFCQGRRAGTYADPDRCSGFIICNIGKTHRMTCGDGLLFNTHGMNCDLPGRVDCQDRPLDSPMNNHENIKDQFGGEPVQETTSHEQEQKPIGIRVTERKGSSPIREGHIVGDIANSQEQPKVNARHFPKDNDQPLKPDDTHSPTINEFDDKLDGVDTEEPPSIQLGVDFRDKKKEEKMDDSSTQTDTNHKTTSSKEPVLHVLINGKTPMSSNSDDEASKSRPSFQLMVNKDGIKASLGRSQGEEQKKMTMDDNSHSDSNKQPPKHTVHVVINDDQRRRVNDEVEESNSGASKQVGKVGRGDEERLSKPNFEPVTINNKDQVISEEDQRQKQLEHRGSGEAQAEQGQENLKQDRAAVRPGGDNDIQGKKELNGQKMETQKPLLDTIKDNVNEMKPNIDKGIKLQNLNEGNKAKEPAINNGRLSMLPLHEQDVPTNASHDTTAMDTQIDVPNKTPVSMNSGGLKTGVQDDTNYSKEDIKNTIDNSTQTYSQEKKKVEKPEPQNALQQSSPPSSSANVTAKPLGHLPMTTTVNKPIQDSNLESIRFKPPRNGFKHPLEALSYENQRTPAILKEVKAENGRNTELTDSSLEHDSMESSGTKINDPETEKETVNPQPNSEGQGKGARPTLDILVNGDNGRTTELRMRNSNNEIARLNDAGGKQAANRDPVVGITIRQKGAPDHHILFSKRQRLSSDKLRHHHHHKHH